ncbi:MAG: fibronectin type III domain-containing protein [Kofleriaceae bacterium]
MAGVIAVAACGTLDAPDDEFGSATQQIGGGTDPIDPPPGTPAIVLNTDRRLRVGFQCGSLQAANTELLRSLSPRGDGTESIWSTPWCVNYKLIDDYDIQPASEYCYEVIAYNDVYDVGTDRVCATSALDQTPATAPSVAIGTVTQTTIDLSLTDRSNNEGWFRVWARPAGSATRVLKAELRRAVRAHRPTGEVLPARLTGLTADTAYTLEVEVGHDFAPSTTAAAPVSVRTLPVPPDAPVGLFVIGKNDITVTVGWTPAARATSYDVKALSGTTVVSSGTTTSTQYQLTGLRASTPYTVQIVARNLGGASAPSAALAVTTDAPPPPPPVPAGLRVTSTTNTSIGLAWTDVAGEDGYKIETFSPSGTTPLRTDSVGASAVAFTVPGLIPGTSYRFTVRSSNRGGLSARSGFVTGTTTGQPPAALPDLAPQMVSLSPAFPSPGQSLTFGWYECHVGPAVPATRTLVRLDGAIVFDQAYVVVANACNWRNIQVGPVGAGNHQLVVQLDANNVVAESNEFNNVNSYGF